MTMKFMQRAAASEASSPASVATPGSDIEGSAKSSAKRRKTAYTPNDSPAEKPLYDEKAIKAALEEEDKKRLAAIERRAKELGDEHWVLPEAQLPASDAKQRVTLNFVQVGFAQIDGGDISDDAEDASRSKIGVPRRLQFNMKKPKAEVRSHAHCTIHSTNIHGLTRHQENASSESDSDGSSDEEEESDDDEATSPNYNNGPGRGRAAEGTPSGNKRRARSSVSTRREEERIRAAELAEKRRKKEVKLNAPTSISSSSGFSNQAFQQRPKNTQDKCFNCGKTGHFSKECPSRRKSRN
jgi:hypothetical protein